MLHKLQPYWPSIALQHTINDQGLQRTPPRLLRWVLIMLVYFDADHMLCNEAISQCEDHRGENATRCGGNTDEMIAHREHHTHCYTCAGGGGQTGRTATWHAQCFLPTPHSNTTQHFLLVQEVGRVQRDTAHIYRGGNLCPYDVMCNMTSLVHTLL